MVKKVYNINGFDCANCASRTEKHLNSCPFIESARIDFSKNRLFISYKKEEKTIPQLKKIIKEVESNDLEITDSDIKVRNTTPIFTKKMLFDSIRVVLSIIFALIGQLAFGIEHYWWMFGFYMVSILIASFDVLYKTINRLFHLKNPFDECAFLLIAVFGAIGLSLFEKLHPDYEVSWHFLFDGAMVVLLYQIGKIIESIAVNKSKNAIMSAIDMRIETVHLIGRFGIKDVPPSDLKVDDEIIVKVGETIPVDGLVLEGEGIIDTSFISGEPAPILVKEESEVFSGTVLKEGSLIIKVTTDYENSTISKILNLVTNSEERKSKADLFINKFALWYTPSVLIFALFFILIGGCITQDWMTFIFKGLEFLVVSCPCAIVISVPLAYFSGIGLASKNGILIKGSVYLESLSNTKKVVVDKTGTLTKGVFQIFEIHEKNATSDELIDVIYAAESQSVHPIGKAISHWYDVNNYIKDITEYEEKIGYGVTLTYKGDQLVVGSAKLMELHKIEYEKLESYKTIIYAAKNGKYLGYVLLKDEIKETSSEMIELFKKSNVETILLTGDKKEVATSLCNALSIDNFKYELLPQEKVKYLEEEIMTNKGETIYMGDGINDAASIKLADVGVAMGGIGSDIAVENADIVLMTDEPVKLFDAFKISKMTKHTAIFNIIFSLFIKFSIITMAAIIPNFPMIVAVLANTGLTILMVLNSLILLYRKIKRK